MAKPVPAAPPAQRRVLDFFKQRFSTYDFMGLPFTLLLCLLLALPLGYYVVIQQVLSSGESLTLDQILNKIMLCLRTPARISLAIWTTYLGSRIIVTSLTIVVMIIFWLRDKKSYIIPMGVSVLGSTLFMALGKMLYFRPRPLHAVYTDLTLSYPSGHATLAFACYGFITYFLWRTFATRRARVLILLLGSLIIAAIAFSRVYLGVHYLSDVWSGALLGSAWLAIAISISEWRLRYVARESREPSRRRKLAIGGLLAAELVLFLFLASRFKAAAVPRGATVALLIIEGKVRPVSTAAAPQPPAAAAAASSAAAAPPLTSAAAPPPAIPAPAPIENAVSQMNAAVKPAEAAAAPKIIVSGPWGSMFAKYNLPTFTESLTSTAQEPLNVIVVGSQESLIRAFQLGGWTPADPFSLSTLFRLARSASSNSADPAAPLTPSFWNGQPHGFGFEKAGEKNSVRERHHARFWTTNLRTADGQTVYAGTASFDVGVKWGGLTHVISPDIDTERELLFNDLRRGGEVSDFEKRPLVRPMRGKNAGGDSFFTDGEAYTLYLK